MKHTARKRWSQNFLIDPVVISRIVAAIRPISTDHLLEIGPGQGALTAPLLSHVAKMDALEIDRDLVSHLRAQWPALHVHEGDALTVDFSQFQPQPLRVVGNLPYHISTPLLFHCLSHLSHIQDMHFMLQKEVGDRIVATPGSKIYGRLSVMIQQACHATMVLDVPPGAFRPVPAVDSIVIRLVPHHDFHLTSPALFAEIVQRAFSQRRKTLRKSLQDTVPESVFVALAIDPGARPETLSVAQFVAIANRVGSIA